MKPFVYKFMLISFITGLFFVSCTNDVDLTNISSDIQWDGALAIPIGEANLNIENLLAQIDSQKILITEGEEIIYQSEDSTIFRFRDIDLTKNAQPLNISFIFPISQTIPANNSYSFEKPNELINLGINTSPEEQIDSVRINNALLSIKIVSENLSISPNNVELILEFPQNKVRHFNGDTVCVNYKPADFNNPTVKEINNFIINTSQSSTIPFTLKLKFTAGSVPITIYPSSKIDVEIKFTHFDFEVAYGFFAPGSIATSTQQQSLDLPSFIEDFQFVDPQVILNIKSNIGTYLYFKINYIKAYLQEKPSSCMVYASFNGNPSTQKALGIKPSQPGEWATTQISLDKNYGSIDKFFSITPKPDMVEYMFSTTLDQEKIDQDHSTNFITSDAQIKVKYKIKIPFYLKPQSYYVYEDTLKDVDIDSTLEDVKIDSAKMILNVANGLPVKVELTMSLFDEDNQMIETTFKTTYQIDAPQIDANGCVIPTDITPQKIIVSLNNEQLNDFKRAKNIIFQIKINSKDVNSYIHFQKSNTFRVKMSFFVKGNYTSNNDNSK